MQKEKQDVVASNGMRIESSGRRAVHNKTEFVVIDVLKADPTFLLGGVLLKFYIKKSKIYEIYVRLYHPIPTPGTSVISPTDPFNNIELRNP